MRDGLPRASAYEAGLNERALAALIKDSRASGQDLHNLTICRDGVVALEATWWPYEGRRQIMHSIAKSFTSAAIGFAIAEGLLSLGDKVINFFPEYLPNDISTNLAAMTVEDLLTMRCGHASENSGSVWRRIETSWIAEFFKVPVVHRPGTVFVYTSAASYMLSAILTKVSGQRLHDYLRPRLFEPLGINGESWDIGVDGINPGGNGLTCKPIDMMKLGLLYAQKGIWEGRQLLSEGWVAASTHPHSRHGDAGLGYGYQWYTGPEDEFYVTGQFGQLIAVFPKWQIVAVVTSATPGKMPVLGQIVPMLRKHLPDVVRGAVSDPELGRLLQSAAAASVLQSDAQGKCGVFDYVIKENELQISRIRLEIEKTRCTMLITDRFGSYPIVMGINHWLEGEASVPGADLHHGYSMQSAKVVAGARWVGAETIEMHWLFAESIFHDTVVFELRDARLSMERSVNLNSSKQRWPAIEGELVSPTLR